MSKPVGPISPRRLPFAAVALAFAVSGCATPYELRMFTSFAPTEPWGSVFVGASSQGRWKEAGVNVEGTPYSVTIASRLTQRPASDCELRVSHLSITPATQAKPVFEATRLPLEAGQTVPHDPGRQPYSPHFTAHPADGTYGAFVTIPRVDLPYQPLRVAFDLQGSPSCPSALLTPVHYDALIEPHPYKGKAWPLPTA